MGLGGDQIKPTRRSLTGFNSQSEKSIGTIKLLTEVGGIAKITKFIVVDAPPIYSAILGTPWLNAMKAVSSTYHLCLKFPTLDGTVFTLYGSQKDSRTCYVIEKKQRLDEEREAEDVDLFETKKNQSHCRAAFAVEKTAQVCIDETDTTRCVAIGKDLDSNVKDELVNFLQKHSATFAWSIADMAGIDPDITSHELNVDPNHKPVRQKRRKLGTDRATAVQEEVERLLRAGQILEVQYPEWLANPVVVKKKNGKWRTCIDFTDLNKACPKDSFPLPHIDRLVEATAGHQLLSFMDAFSGYNQIMMHPNDREKTAFITDRGTYCYKVMPFGLKNAGATYQRLVNRMFSELLGKTMEVYIDDMLVKSLDAKDHVEHLKACFDILDQFGMKLNPTKCTFGVKSGEFLGYIVTERGIEANPKQISAILEMPSPKDKKEVQRLTGRIAALNRFISRSTDRCLPFYELLRGNRAFKWDEQCERAFSELKEYLTSQPVLVKPEDGDTLYLYVAVSSTAISGVLIKEDRGEQRPVFYTSKSLVDAELRYPTLEKMALAVVTAARKLRPYFQSHAIVVLSDQPLRTILHSPTQSGRMAKWAIELSEYDIEYRGRSSQKGQVLADFITELPAELIEGTPNSELWTLHVDGSSSKHGAGVGVRLESPTGEILEQSFRLEFNASNNEAEYEALLAGLRLARGMGIKRIHALCDSQLVANQFSGEYEAKNERMDAYLKLTQQLAKEFDEFDLTKIPRADNAPADALAALGSASKSGVRRTIPVESIQTPSIELGKGVCAVSTDERLPDELNEESPHDEVDAEPDETSDTMDWRADIARYLEEGTAPPNRWEARRLKTRAANYCLLDGNLFRWSAGGILLTCVSNSESKKVMRDVHEGSGGNHSGARSLVLKIKKSGHYWPTMMTDCEAFAKKCEKCQRHAQVIHMPTELLASATQPYPFMRWAMDAVGPLIQSNGKQHILIMTDYFTKWVEAESYISITGLDVVHFVWKFIITRHGLPYEIVTDNGTNFTSEVFKDFCTKWKIRLSFSTPRYPQGNGQAEATNKTILDGLRKRLESEKDLWALHLDGVLWSHRTTPRRSTEKSPFSLAYGVEALSPAEVRIPTLRRQALPSNPELNEAMLIDNLDFIEGERIEALLRVQNYQHLAAKYYNKKVRNRHFTEGDLVLRKVFHNTEEKKSGKLGAKWEGPYQILKVVKPGVYWLMTMEGKAVRNSWNSMNLKRYYY